MRPPSEQLAGNRRRNPVFRRDDLAVASGLEVDVPVQENRFAEAPRVVEYLNVLRGFRMETQFHPAVDEVHRGLEHCPVEMEGPILLDSAELDEPEVVVQIRRRRTDALHVAPVPLQRGFPRHRMLPVVVPFQPVGEALVEPVKAEPLLAAGKEVLPDVAEPPLYLPPSLRGVRGRVDDCDPEAGGHLFGVGRLVTRPVVDVELLGQSPFFYALFEASFELRQVLREAEFRMGDQPGMVVHDGDEVALFPRPLAAGNAGAVEDVGLPHLIGVSRLEGAAVLLGASPSQIVPLEETVEGVHADSLPMSQQFFFPQFPDDPVGRQSPFVVFLDLPDRFPEGFPQNPVRPPVLPPGGEKPLDAVAGVPVVADPLLQGGFGHPRRCAVRDVVAPCGLLPEQPGPLPVVQTHPRDELRDESEAEGGNLQIFLVITHCSPPKIENFRWNGDTNPDPPR